MNLNAAIGSVGHKEVSVSIVYQKYDEKKPNVFSATQLKDDHYIDATMRVNEKSDGGGSVLLSDIWKSICKLVQNLAAQEDSEDGKPLLLPKIGQGLAIWCGDQYGKGPRTQNFRHLFRDQFIGDDPEIPVFSS